MKENVRKTIGVLIAVMLASALSTTARADVIWCNDWGTAEQQWGWAEAFNSDPCLDCDHGQQLRAARRRRPGQRFPRDVLRASCLADRTL